MWSSLVTLAWETRLFMSSSWVSRFSFFTKRFLLCLKLNGFDFTSIIVWLVFILFEFSFTGTFSSNSDYSDSSSIIASFFLSLRYLLFRFSLSSFTFFSYFLLRYFSLSLWQASRRHTLATTIVLIIIINARMLIREIPTKLLLLSNTSMLQ